MKHKLKWLIISILVLTVLAAYMQSLAVNTNKNITAAINSVTVKINGQLVSGDKILYNGNVYIRADKVGDVLNKKFEWDKNKNVISIIDRGISTPAPVPTITPAAVPSPTPTIAPLQNEKTNITVYRTIEGHKYHRSGCRYLRESMIPISLEEAKKWYGPCSVCNPPY